MAWPLATAMVIDINMSQEAAGTTDCSMISGGSRDHGPQRSFEET